MKRFFLILSILFLIIMFFCIIYPAVYEFNNVITRMELFKMFWHMWLIAILSGFLHLFFLVKS